LDTNYSVNIRFKQQMTSVLIWDWVKNSVTNEERNEIPVNSQVMLLEKHVASTPTHDLRVGYPFSSTLGRTQKPRKEVVYVEHSNNQEHLIYKSKQMKVGKLYPITWNGEKLVLRKTNEGAVQILESISEK